MAGVVLEDVSRVYSGRSASSRNAAGTARIVAVNHVNLQVRDREFLVVVGPSGCGKSTTLRLIAGLEDLTTGQIRIGDRIVNGVPPKDRDVAMVFQNYALYPHMSVYKNMAFGLSLRYGESWLKQARWRLLEPDKAREMAARRREIPERVRQTARSLGIEGLLDRMPAELSGGERQRVALGRAIVRQPAAFLFDEPLSNLDAQLRGEMRRELKLLHRNLSATMIYVTHDQVEALTLGDRVAVFDRGSVQQVGAPLEVYDWPANRFVASFIGTPAMNMLDGVLRREAGPNGVSLWSFVMANASLSLGESLRGVAEPLHAWQQAHATASVLTLGVRPEDVRLVEATAAEAMPSADRPSAEKAWLGPISCGVTLVETLGDSSIVHVARGVEGVAGEKGASSEQAARIDPAVARDVRLVAKCDPRGGWREGQAVRAWLRADRVRWFDQETTLCLSRPPAGEVFGP